VLIEFESSCNAPLHGHKKNKGITELFLTEEHTHAQTHAHALAHTQTHTLNHRRFSKSKQTGHRRGNVKEAAGTVGKEGQCGRSCHERWLF